ncbi:hypothetical protein [Trinickia dinghuensis]|uniref:hypothetical protein n=1 Tax=Trinickia dinghuensis TaxID=2291023 RepID=UPI0015F1A6B0|nr:hypothetical protein [Trinickia dinghuensis]
MKSTRMLSAVLAALMLVLSAGCMSGGMGSSDHSTNTTDSGASGTSGGSGGY